ncbi:MAG: tetratricopeptide repeat protein [Ferrovum sp.]|nr:tetratricopeptide repeat protein [Ferrovum sp.]NDU88156.1 tetratricopeptide repeat protein [Ferrovum sp.]
MLKPKLAAWTLALGFSLSPLAHADMMFENIAQEQHAWAKGYYTLPEAERDDYFAQLQTHAHDLSSQYPGHAEPLIWEGIITASHAKYQSVFTAGGTAKEARDVLLKAIAINPNAMDGSGLISLGSLYFKVPRFGSFGDYDKAREYLQRALKIDPNNIDANFFYGEFLLTQDDKTEAIPYLKKAATAMPRPGREDADKGRHAEAAELLAKTEQ